MTPRLSLIAADSLIDALSSALARDADATAAAAEIAPLLRGAAREDDGAAFDLLGRLGFSTATIAAALPRARAAARANAGA